MADSLTSANVVPPMEKMSSKMEPVLDQIFNVTWCDGSSKSASIKLAAPLILLAKTKSRKRKMNRKTKFSCARVVAFSSVAFERYTKENFATTEIHVRRRWRRRRRRWRYGLSFRPHTRICKLRERERGRENEETVLTRTYWQENKNATSLSVCLIFQIYVYISVHVYNRNKLEVGQRQCLQVEQNTDTDIHELLCTENERASEREREATVNNYMWRRMQAM